MSAARQAPPGCAANHVLQEFCDLQDVEGLCACCSAPLQQRQKACLWLGCASLLNLLGDPTLMIDFTAVVAATKA